MRGPVLFAGHGAERSGPPMGLLHLLRWLSANTDLEFGVLLLGGGDLLPEYEALGPVAVVEESHLGGPTAALTDVMNHAGLTGAATHVRHGLLRRRLSNLPRTRFIYVNTAWTIRALAFLDDRDQRVITAVHELTVGLRYHLPRWSHELMLDRTGHYIAVADAVRDELVHHHGVPPASVSVHKEFIALEDGPSAGHEGWAQSRRVELGIPPGAMLVGAAGFTHWRKAPDLFVLLAQEVIQRTSAEVHFVWVGGDEGEGSGFPYGYDVTRSAVADRVHFVGHQDRPLDWFRLLDVMVLTAREDAFPLVCLEAASVGVPVVCFDNGGMPEFVRQAGAGEVVPFPDVVAMAEVVVGLLTDDDRRRAMGARGSVEVRTAHDVERRAPALFDELERRWTMPQ